MKKKFNKVVSLALASVMAMGLFTTVNLGSTTAKAEEAKGPYTEIAVTKNVYVKEKGTSIPEKTFTITMEPATTADLTNDDGTAKTDANSNKLEIGPALTTESIDFEFNSLSDTSKGYATQTDNFKFDFVVPTGSTSAFDHTGVYRYIVKEEIPSDANKTTDSGNKSNGYVTYDTTEYTLDLYVNQDSTGKYVVDNYVLNNGSLEKPKGLIFDNAVNCSELTISKTVEGTEYKQGEEYEFRILIPVGGTTITLTDKSKFIGKIYDANGNQVTGRDYMESNGDVVIKVAGSDITADMKTYGTKFTLKAGEELVIYGVPVSMVYKVQEFVDEKEGYTTTIDYTETGSFSTETAPKTDTGKKTVSGDTLSGTINTSVNTVEFLNSREINTPTGLNIDFLPYALVLLVAVCGSILFIIAKKRKQ